MSERTEETIVFDGKTAPRFKTRKTCPTVVTYNPNGFFNELARPKVCCTQCNERHDDLAVWKVETRERNYIYTGHYCDRHRVEVEGRIGQRIEPPCAVRKDMPT